MFRYYPGVFRIWFGTRLFYVVSDPKYYEILFTSQHTLRKEELYRMAEPVVGDGLVTAPVKKWKKHRKIILPTFNQKILDEFVEVFVEQADIFAEVLNKYSGKGEIDLFRLMFHLTLDTFCETAMGVKVQAQLVGSDVSVWVDRAMEIVVLRMFNIFYHNDSIFNMLPIGKEFREVARKLREFTGRVVSQKRAAYQEKMNKLSLYPEAEVEEPRRKAFLDLMIEIVYKENAVFTNEELIDEVVTFIIAGSDTTASTNCFVLTMLGLHQHIQQKVYEEMVDVLGLDRNVEVTDLPNLKYTERVIKETLRLFPVGPFIVRATDADIDIGECVIPKECSIVFGILGTHTNEKYWPDPYIFDPDRFLPEEIMKRHPCAYVPFSYGPRNCIGPKYAMMAMKCVLATIIRKYKVSTTYQNVEDIKLKSNLVLRPTEGFKVSVELRN